MTLRSTLSAPDSKHHYVKRLFATIAPRYDFITRFLSYGQDRRWKARLIALADLQADDRLLDLACGTGDLVVAAASRVRHAVGLDITWRMLELAASRRPQNVALVTGDICRLPFIDGEFDVVTIGYGLRNAADLRQAIREIVRVLAPGGRMLSLDFNRPQNPLIRAAYLAYLTIVGSALGAALHGDANTYRYIPESIRLYPGARGVADALAAEGLDAVRIVPVLGGFMTIHVARKRPSSVRATARAR